MLPAHGSKVDRGIATVKDTAFRFKRSGFLVVNVVGNVSPLNTQRRTVAGNLYVRFRRHCLGEETNGKIEARDLTKRRTWTKVVREHGYRH